MSNFEKLFDMMQEGTRRDGKLSVKQRNTVLTDLLQNNFLMEHKILSKGDFVLHISLELSIQKIPEEGQICVVMHSGDDIWESYKEMQIRGEEFFGRSFLEFDTIMGLIDANGIYHQFPVDSRFLEKIGNVETGIDEELFNEALEKRKQINSILGGEENEENKE